MVIPKMTDNYIQQADEEHSEIAEDEMAIEEYVEKAIENPHIAAHSVKYILNAIEHYGTRTVFEEGEERERYVFFDDPYNDGENAIIGNSDVLNDFVDELRRMASDKGENERIIWFEGPTATGKSEFKRCLINGIRGYAESEEGARYTVEWSLDALSGEGRITYGDNSFARNWYKSPINIHPLSVFPEETRQNIIEEIDEGEKYPTEASVDLDPFSREAFQTLEEEYDSFEDIVGSEHLQVTRYYPDVGDGIGVLHTEDNGDEKQRLVGDWMRGAMEEFPSRGRKNAQAFSYDGVLCQGNGAVSIVEDASHHSDVLDKMMNVCEEKMVKLDNKIAMELDTLLLIISNPDLEEQLSEYADAGQADPLRALRRRMDKYELNYLVTPSLEAMLIRRLLTGSNEMWDDEEDRMEIVREPLEVYESEIAPYAIEAAAMYEVVSRLTDGNLSFCEKALLLENGEITSDGDKYEIDDYQHEISEDEGEAGIPVTYTVDKIVDSVQEQDVVYPDDILETMRDGLEGEPIFSGAESSHFRKMKGEVGTYIFKKQEEDVLEAMVGDITITEEDVREYIDGILAWEDEEEEEYDAFELREFETRFLGQEPGDYDNKASPSNVVRQFRRDIITTINKFMWDERTDGYEVQDVPLSESPQLNPLLEENDWSMVNRIFPDADLDSWRNPPSNTQTKELKDKTIERMVEELDYSEESAETVSTKIVKVESSYQDTR